MISKLAITVICLGVSFAAVAQTTAASGWTLLSDAQVKGPGIYLNQIVVEGQSTPEEVRLAPSPAPGRTIEWSKQQVAELARKAGLSSVLTQWSGAERIRISRPGRMLAEGELKDLLTATIQNEIVRDKGELELRLSRPWAATLVPDEPLRVRVVDVPVAGVTPNFIARFELRTDHELLGTWQAALQAKVWRDVWVARSAQPRGRLLKDADLVQERRDVLMTREALAALEVPEGSLELAESLTVGAPVLARSVRLRPVVCRGKAIEALLKDGALMISVRVEALEDGLPGQTIRVRNQKTRRELQAKVQDEQTVIINL
jgi:flagella basal body P-ring formation protein FlgA